ncbi:MAG: glycosyltransferase family 4 protein [Thermoplasmata archaeon]
MRVLMVGFDPLSSGIGSYSIELAKLINSFAQTFIVSLNEKLKLENIETIEIYYSSLPSFTPLLNGLLINKKIVEIYNEISPDIIHETLPPVAFSLDKRVTTRWGYVNFFQLAWIRSTQMPFPYNLGGIPVTTQHLIGDLLSHHNAKKIIDVSQNTENFIPPPMSVGPLKPEAEEESLQLLFVARDIRIKRKNLKVILDALKISKKRYTLHIVGKGDIKGENIIYHGYKKREDLLKIMNKCDVLILPSTYEELGYVGLEAYSIGLPVIASNITSFRTVFKKSIFFNPYNPVELANLLDSLDREKLRNIGIESREYLIKANELAKNKLLEIYKSITLK